MSKQFNVSCKGGSLRLSDHTVRIHNMSGKVLWQMPVKAVTGVEEVSRKVMSTIVIRTLQGDRTVEWLLPDNVARLQQALAASQADAPPFSPQMLRPPEHVSPPLSATQFQPQMLQSSGLDSPLSPAPPFWPQSPVLVSPPPTSAPAMQPPPKRRRAWPWVIAVILVLVSIGLINTALSSGSSTGNAASTPTAAAQSQATLAPKPTPTPTVKQNIIQIVNTHTSRADKIDFTQNNTVTVVVQITLSEMLDQGDARNTIQLNCFNIEKALWTDHITSLKDVALAFRDPSQDKYGNPSISPYGSCDLTAAIAARFNWDNLTISGSWNAYDSAQFYPIILG